MKLQSNINYIKNNQNQKTPKPQNPIYTKFKYNFYSFNQKNNLLIATNFKD